MRKQLLALASGLLLLGSPLYAQISQGGTPRSFSLGTLKANSVVLPAPDLRPIAQEDAINEKNGRAWRMAVAIKAGLNPSNSGNWVDLGRGEKLWMLRIESKNAKALGVYYDRFYLPKGSTLFLYNDDRTQVLGAYTADNNPIDLPNFANEMVAGDAVTLEYFQPAYVKENPIIQIGEIAYAYRGFQELTEWKVNESDPCQVNVNCSEGTNWQNHKRSVAKIVLKQGVSFFLCSGAVVNNTAQDGKPYFLTAEHCGETSSTADYNQWVFHFNYEASGCANPTSAPASQTLTGCVKRSSSADGGGNTGSDFKLLEFSTAIPSTYNVYYAGWNRNNVGAPSGVSIHHPSGDIKKISTYTSTLTSTSWGGSVANTHWRVVWSATANGHGVTEGGSSGSPIFDNNGRIVGTLTGGASYCTATSSPDQYGKFSYSWASNGTTADRRLSNWLDPANTGATTLDGAFLNGTPGPTPITYCASKGNSVADEWIQSVAIGSFSKNSGKNAGYADFTADKITLSRGSTINLTLTPGFTSTAYNEYWRIWVDYNKDGDFDDAGELVYDAGSLSSAVRTGSFVVPSGATLQETRMRVSMKYNGSQTPCETFSYGEVEDYTAVITDAAPTTCNAPTSASAGSVTSSSFVISWPAVSGAASYQVEFKTSSATTYTTATTTATSYTASGLSASTAYNYRVRTNCSSGTSGYTAVGTVTTSAPPAATYCASRGNSVADEWIRTVRIGTINNTSNANAGYANFTNLSTTLEIGEGTAITLTPGFRTNALGQSITFPEYWRVWVDLNGDGDFTDAGELAFDAGATSTTTVNGTVNIAAGTTPKTTRMRVQMKYNGAPTSCEAFAYGEVEDYTVNLVDTRSALASAAAGTVLQETLLFPNPTASDAQFRFSTTSDVAELEVRVVDLTGRIMQSLVYRDLERGQLIETYINTQNQQAGVYLVQVLQEGTLIHTTKLIKK
ncbi:MAG TPA: GEVED domain-containing protein [Luteibaculaceae bacterium]|nr:GEVED domain-containing protein [Luteibaculaceae bacterium]